MKITDMMNDTAVIEEIGTRLARHRVDRNITQARLAENAGVSKRTIERLESGGSVQLSNLIRILRALSLSENLDSLIPTPRPSPIEQLKHRGKQRVRAGRSPDHRSTGEWTWDDDA